MQEALISLGLLVVVAKLAEGIFRRFHVNSIVAYALTGVMLGPVLGIVHVSDETHLILTIGVFIFFFLIGLDEIDISSFVASMRGRYFVAALLSVLVSIGVAFLVTSTLIYDFGLGLDIPEALALAGVLALTSLGIVAKVLSDDGRMREPLGLQIFTVVVIAELITLLVVGFNLGESGDEISAINALLLVGKIAAFTVVTWLLSSRVIPALIVLLERFFNVPHLSYGLFLGGLFLMVSGAEAIGLHGSLGGLLFGACLSGMPYQVRRDMMPGMRSTGSGLFVPLFFASAGLHLSVSFIHVPPITIAALVVIPLLGKFAGAFIGAYAARLPTPYALATGLMGKGVAEIALLLVMFEHEVINREIFSLLIVVMFGYILLTPPAISFAVSRASASSGSNVLPDDLPSGIVSFALDDLKVQDILDRTRNHPSPTLTVRDFADRWIVPQEQDYVVVNRGILHGIVSLSALRYLPKGAWATTRLYQVIRSETPNAWPDESIEDVLQRMSELSISALPVLERGTFRFLGTVTQHEIIDLMVLESGAEH